MKYKIAFGYTFFFFNSKSFLIPCTRTSPFTRWVECSPMARKIGVQSQVESYQRLKKWYLIPPCLIFNIIRYVSRVKWTNLRRGVAPSPTSRRSSYWKGSLWVTLDDGRPTYLYIYIILFTIKYMCVCVCVCVCVFGIK